MTLAIKVIKLAIKSTSIKISSVFKLSSSVQIIIYLYTIISNNSHSSKSNKKDHYSGYDNKQKDKRSKDNYSRSA